MARWSQHVLLSRGLAGFGALALASLLFAQNPEPGSEDRTDSVPRGQLLIAQGLSMALEGSMLESLALRRSGSLGGVGAAGNEAPVGPGTSVTGGTRTQAPSGRDADLGRAGGVGRTPTPVSGAEVPGQQADGPETKGAVLDPSAMELHRHAMYAFDVSDRLLRQATQAGKASRASRFQAAATRYAKSLRQMAEQNVDPGDVVPGADPGQTSALPPITTPTPGITATQPPGGATTARPDADAGVTIDARRSAAAKRARGVSSFAGAMNESSITAIAVLNHGVKATLDSLQLKMTVRMMNAADTPDGRALLAHARELEAKGILAIEGILTASTTRPREGAAAPGAGGVAGSQGRAIQDLAIQAHDIVLAIDELSGERRSTAEGQRDDAASKPEFERSTPKAETPKPQ